MSKTSRDIPKAIAHFGEKQFKETGASLVEVLRIKEVVLRKYFKQLRGILYLVAVVSRDRVRVYFFNAAGVMVIGENLEPVMYDDIRKTSKLLARFEKPIPLTLEELRIEATQELRDGLGKAMRRVSRLLSLKEPPFPDIFITRRENKTEGQNFGIDVSDDGELLFEESTGNKAWIDGLLVRAAFLTFFDTSQWRSEYFSLVGNSIALTLTKGEARTAWYNEWKRNSKDDLWYHLFNHFTNHSSTYESRGYLLLKSFLSEVPSEISHLEWMDSIRIIHDSILLSLGTEAYHIIKGFCKSLENPNQLVKQRHVLQSIHLSPRAICDPTSLGISLSTEIREQPSENSWTSINFISGAKVNTLEICQSEKEPISSIEYSLNLEDAFPLTGGILAHGRDTINSVLERIGIKRVKQYTFESTLEFKERPALEKKDIAVLERLVLGKTKILSDTLIGSPLIIRNLMEKGVVVLLPNFNHLGLESDLLIHGQKDDVRSVARTVPEATIFSTERDAYAVLSTPTNWKRPVIDSAVCKKLAIWTITSITSPRQLLRDEQVFPTDDQSSR